MQKINALCLEKSNKHLIRIPFDNLKLAHSFFQRLKGLLGKKNIKETEGLLIEPCNQVHTLGMKFSIDTVFIDRQNRVVKVVNHLKPYRQARHKEARYVLELAAGMASHFNIELGDYLTW